jgi:hypothetical protein
VLTYRSRHKPDIDIAWSDAFLGAAAFIADRERDRIERQKKEATHSNVPNNSGNFQYRV